MTISHRRKSVSGASRDFISQLPADVKDRILERLPTPDAARTSLLSKEWKNVWLSHGRLVFDLEFFKCMRKFEEEYRRLISVNIINDILSRRARPVKKFTLRVSFQDVPPLQSDLDRWCLFLSNNGVEELKIEIFDAETWGKRKYRLPDCIVSCPTLKQLKLGFFSFGYPANATSIFPNVTSLTFREVLFEPNVNGIVSCILNLQKLVFFYCHGTDNFKISAPKLVTLSGKECYMGEAGWTQFALHWKTIKTLYLSGCFMSEVPSAVLTAKMFPFAMNLQVITLAGSGINFASRQHLTFLMLLLQNSPKLCELNIYCRIIWEDDDDSDDDDVEAASRLLEDPNGCFINRDLKMLNTVKIYFFNGSVHELLFVKVLLSNSPSLDKVVIEESFHVDATLDLKIARELLCLPRLSQKARLFFTKMTDLSRHVITIYGYGR